MRFELTYREGKRITITVDPEKQVTVRAPDDRSLEEVICHVRKRASWIAKQQRYFDQFHPLPPERRYVSGETHFYLGRQYRLRVCQEGAECVKLKGKYFWVSARDHRDSVKIKALMESWYRDHARSIFTRYLEECLQIARSLGVKAPKVILRRMERRWGSCTNNGHMLLNPDLVKTPVHCIQYVIMHELCHLKARNHARHFQRLMDRYMPDWRRRKATLDTFVQ